MTDQIEFTWAESAYPKLAKSSSDGFYCYYFQRRLSCYVSYASAKLGISPDQSTWIDLTFALTAAVCLMMGYPITAVVLIQLFGIWSCVDGEVARLTGKTSKVGDYFDTMVDRLAEIIFVAGLLLLLLAKGSEETISLYFFTYIGAVFLITVSSEKYRSASQKNYPKKEIETVFSWICAGSDIRFLYLSLAIIAMVLSDQVRFVLVTLAILSVALYLNFLFRMWKIYRLNLLA
ncbi:MAG: CDP-alcohol phosphatidyltransferase family protein [Pseudomonadales bacterium]|jgi:phosphatidylglycerophosphate synthase|nr:CDP-alcohol phosphatidyltransferase family protein [Pseudomonadales bacterium]MDP7145030.1 CDP-alcohol phosphatidyltransferase family protein [Pseudomonadales bacterium]MDP7358522.1 CDP-alcohol phosphatidyltransferase family protein [Pseudomonadales bacterium]MDP7595109.1 CDP-alcohol phosphatidyltransferase family protein [Pseudomonadales bacterium]HJN51311.1 CDP-alcohol phosphatidyltransferase family protein [Pseudomonadales bacterium]|tara:strand:- start:411 stop:1109 length:699 start_codon:yes stop_codon:yes gene_type:complete